MKNSLASILLFSAGLLAASPTVKAAATELFAYRASSGAVPGKEWKSTYLPGKVKMIDSPEPLLALDNADPKKRYQSFSLADTKQLSDVGNHILLRCRVRMANAPEHPSAGFFCAGIYFPAEGRMNVFAVYFLAKNRLGADKTRKTLAVKDVTQLHDYEFEIDAAKQLVLVRQDGVDVGDFPLAEVPDAKPGCFFGDASGVVAGAAEVAYVEFRKLD